VALYRTMTVVLLTNEQLAGDVIVKEGGGAGLHRPGCPAFFHNGGGLFVRQIRFKRSHFVLPRGGLPYEQYQHYGQGERQANQAEGVVTEHP